MTDRLFRFICIFSSAAALFVRINFIYSYLGIGRVHNLSKRDNIKLN